MPSEAPISRSASSTRNGSLERLEDLLPDLGAGVGVGRGRQQDGELVAAEPGDRVARAQDAGDARADELQQLVAAVVAERVVDLLELVEVEEHHDRPRAVAARRRRARGRRGPGRARGSAGR